MCYVKFKETDQICSLLNFSQAINTKSACNRNNKDMYSCFYGGKKFLSCLMYWEGKNTTEVFLKNPLENGHWSRDERKRVWSK